jgi:hypothetical protein
LHDRSLRLRIGVFSRSADGECIRTWAAWRRWFRY